MKVVVLLSSSFLGPGSNKRLPRSSGEPSPDYLPIAAYCKTSRSIWSSDAFTSSPSPLSAPSSQKCTTQPTNPLVTSSCIPPVCSYLRANRLGWPSSSAHGFTGFSVGGRCHGPRGIYRNCTNCTRLYSSKLYYLYCYCIAQIKMSVSPLQCVNSKRKQINKSRNGETRLNSLYGIMQHVERIYSIRARCWYIRASC